MSATESELAFVVGCESATVTCRTTGAARKIKNLSPNPHPGGLVIPGARPPFLF
jgi:hypothetical protein